MEITTTQLRPDEDVFKLSAVSNEDIENLFAIQSHESVISSFILALMQQEKL